jgi:plastocyanin
MQLWCKQLLVLAAAGVLALFAAAAAQADGWGTIKGQVVWDGKEAPKRAPVNVTKDQGDCEKNGKLFEDKLVVNPKNKGVRWCLVYLMNEKGFEKDIPIKPNLKELKTKTVELDQPCCQFEPHMLAMREGQTLIVKNSATISHNVNIVGGAKPPNVNQIVPAGGKFTVEDIKARPIPIMVKCDIHPWMGGRIAVLKNPYFAVTDADGNFEIKDAPAGDFRLVIWHEEAGWVIGDAKPTRNGKKITIKAGETTDLGKVPMKATNN